MKAISYIEFAEGLTLNPGIRVRLSQLEIHVHAVAVNGDHNYIWIATTMHKSQFTLIRLLSDNTLHQRYEYQTQMPNQHMPINGYVHCTASEDNTSSMPIALPLYKSAQRGKLTTLSVTAGFPSSSMLLPK